MHVDCYKKMNDTIIFIHETVRQNILTCDFRSLSDFQCECNYYSIDTKNISKENFNFTGNVLENWHNSNSIVSINRDSSRPSSETKSFEDLCEYCMKDMSNSRVRCIYNCNQTSTTKCFCFKEISEVSQTQFDFYFNDVFANESIFSEKFTKDRLSIPPPTHPFSLPHPSMIHYCKIKLHPNILIIVFHR